MWYFAGPVLPQLHVSYIFVLTTLDQKDKLFHDNFNIVLYIEKNVQESKKKRFINKK